MYYMYIPVLHVYVCIVGIACMVCICMYLHVLYVLNILYVRVCIICICLYVLKCFCRYIHIHTHTYIHTIQTKYRFVANACMCMCFWVNTYIIQTAGFTYIQLEIQTCRVPDDPNMFEQEPWPRSTQTESQEPKISKPESRSAEEDLTMKYRNTALPLITSQPEMQWLRKWSMTSTPQGMKTMTLGSVKKAI
jgi:hypothetical protein